MKFVEPRPFADPKAAARKLVELAYAFEPIQDGRIYIEKSNGPFLYELKGTPAEYKAGLDYAIAKTATGPPRRDGRASMRYSGGWLPECRPAGDAVTIRPRRGSGDPRRARTYDPRFWSSLISVPPRFVLYRVVLMDQDFLSSA
jgi:hypothetical protein